MDFERITIIKLLLLSVLVCVVSSTLGKERFSNPLSDVEFEERKRQWEERITRAEALAKTKMPSTGYLAAEIAPGTPAQSLGFKVGDVVPFIDGQTLWGSVKWKERSGLAELVHFTDEGVETIHQVPPGIIGLYEGRHDAPELDFLRSREGREAAVMFATLGLLAWNEDPALAEAAWFRAVEAGYQQDEYSKYALLMMSLGDEGLPSLITSFLDHGFDDGVVPACFLDGLVAVATSCGHLDALKRIGAQESPFYWSPDEIATLEDFTGGSPTSTGNLLARVRAMPYEIVGRELRIDPRYNEIMGLANAEILGRPARGFSKSQNSLMRTVVCGPEAIRNVHVSISIGRLSVTQTDRKRSNEMCFGLIHGDYLNPGGRGEFPPREMTLLSSGIEFISTAIDQHKIPVFQWISSGMSAQWPTHASPFFGERTLSNGEATTTLENLFFDLIRLDSEVACYVNGICYLRMPVDPNADDISVFVRMSGCMVESFDCLIREIVPDES